MPKCTIKSVLFNRALWHQMPLLALLPLPPPPPLLLNRALWHQIPLLSRAADLWLTTSLDAYMMRQKERSPLKGSILANDCGTGKTLTITTLQYMYYRELKQHAVNLATWKAEKEKAGLDPTPPASLSVAAYPMLLLCPAALVSQHAEELISKFKGLLHVHVYYGSKSTAPPSRAAETLSPDEWEAEMVQRAANVADPEVSRMVPMGHVSRVDCDDDSGLTDEYQT